jgi:hypothetical protein
MSVLQFDWEAIAHQRVLSVVGRNERRMSDGSLAWDALAFVVGDSAVVLTVTADTDEIAVGHEPAPRGWNEATTLREVIGKPLGWCWVGVNYRGYRDSFTLAFGDALPDALQPRLTFMGEGASLSCFDVTPRGA